MMEDNQQEDTGAQGQVWGLHRHRYVTRAAGRDRNRSRQGMDLYEVVFYHLQMTTRQKTLPTRIPRERDKLILSCSFLRNLGRALYVNPATVSAAALGLVFCLVSKRSKNKKQIARPEYDETEE